MEAARAIGVDARAHEMARVLQRHRADERIRQRQQGFGKPIIGTKVGATQFIAVGNTVHWQEGCRTFGDFLMTYVKRKLDPAWGNAELAKPWDERHPLLQWYDRLCRYQQAHVKTPGIVVSSPITGIVACYLGLTYGLYLLDHNVELQERLIHRLKDPAQFQGAYYEVFVARVLIRAGFTLELEDETDRSLKHCEFSATKDGKKYWVEAKMRSIAGLLGKTTKDGGSDKKPTKKLVEHLNAALAKPARDSRLIFIDLNTAEGISDPTNVRWRDVAVERLERFERDELPAGEAAYVFVTNIAYHRQLDCGPTGCVLPFGLGLDFERPGTMRVSEAWRRKQRHLHGHAILESIAADLRFPATFDGEMPSVAFHGSQRVLIGNTYHFTDIGEGGTIATVTAASVEESSGTAYIAIHEPKTDAAQIISRKLSPEEVADYVENRDSYFGEITSNTNKKQLNTPFELFEWLMEANKAMSREMMLKAFAGHPEFIRLSALSDNDLRVEYTEGLVASTMRMRPKAA